MRDYWLYISLSILAVIITLSLYPVSQLPDVPGTDKLHHFIAYGALMFPVALRKPKYWRWIALLFILASGTIELIQPYVNRYGEWLDLAANCLGLLCGFILAQLIAYLSVKREK